MFGHYHSIWGVERVIWKTNHDEVAEAQILSGPEGQHEFNFSAGGQAGVVEKGRNTIFVNADDDGEPEGDEAKPSFPHHFGYGFRP